MVTMLDCIKRVPVKLNEVIENRKATFEALMATFGDRDIDEIFIIGSGTSLSSAQTARYIAEGASGLRVTISAPNEFLNALTYRNPNALYVIISQTGTSILTREAVLKLNDMGYMTAAISEKPDTPIARDAKIFIDMGCGYEEYGMRTIGYSCTVLTVALLGMELGLKQGTLSQSKYDDLIAQAQRAVDHLPEIIKKAETWMDESRRPFLKADCITLNGSGALYGVALEAAIKLWEAPQIISIGYELEEGLHAPNFGYNHRHAVVVLNDGGFDNDRAMGLYKYMRCEKDNGYIIGVGATDESDLGFTPQGGAFNCLEFASAIQVFAYRLMVDGGRDLTKPRKPTNMEKYFKSHS